MCEIESMLSVSALGGFGYISALDLTQTLSHIDVHVDGALRLQQGLPFVVYNPHHYLPSLLSSAPAFPFAICLFPMADFTPPQMATAPCCLPCARSTVPTTTWFFPPLHNSNGQKPLLVLTGLDDLGFAHTVVTQVSVVFRGLCD